MLVGARAEVYSWVGLRKGYSTKLPLIRRWRCGARVVEEPGLRQPDSQCARGVMLQLALWLRQAGCPPWRPRRLDGEQLSERVLPRASHRRKRRKARGNA